jgi:hypothetical protein
VLKHGRPELPVRVSKEVEEQQMNEDTLVCVEVQEGEPVDELVERPQPGVRTPSDAERLPGGPKGCEDLIPAVPDFLALALGLVVGPGNSVDEGFKGEGTAVDITDGK